MWQSHTFLSTWWEICSGILNAIGPLLCVSSAESGISDLRAGYFEGCNFIEKSQLNWHNSSDFLSSILIFATSLFLPCRGMRLPSHDYLHIAIWSTINKHCGDDMWFVLNTLLRFVSRVQKKRGVASMDFCNSHSSQHQWVIRGFRRIVPFLKRRAKWYDVTGLPLL